MKHTLLLLILASCGGEPAAPSNTPASPTTRPVPVDKVTVTTTSFPAAWLVQRIAGDVVEHSNVLPVGEDAPFWQPTGDVVAAVATSNLIVTNGAGFERWLATATLPEGIVVDSSEGVPLITVKSQTHSHGKGGEHSHAGTDPHTWSDPLTFGDQARNVHRALSNAAPSSAAVLDRNLGALDTELRNLHAAYTEALLPAAGVKLSASHPAFNYLARRYALDLTSFDFDPEEVPSPEALAEFSAWAGEQRAPILLWEGTPTEEVKAAFPAGTRHIFVDPLEQPGPTGSYDYLAQAKANVTVFKELFHAP